MKPHPVCTCIEVLGYPIECECLGITIPSPEVHSIAKGEPLIVNGVAREYDRDQYITRLRAAREVLARMAGPRQRSTEDEAERHYAEQHRCVHRGDHQRDVACRSCGGTVNLPAYCCRLHKCQCVELRRPENEEIRWCHVCSDRDSSAGSSKSLSAVGFRPK